MTLIDLLIAKIGTTNQKINSLRNQIDEENIHILYYKKEIAKHQSMIDSCEHKIEELKWKKR